MTRHVETPRDGRYRPEDEIEWEIDDDQWFLDLVNGGGLKSSREKAIDATRELLVALKFNESDWIRNRGRFSDYVGGGGGGGAGAGSGVATPGKRRRTGIGDTVEGGVWKTRKFSEASFDEDFVAIATHVRPSRLALTGYPRNIDGELLISPMERRRMAGALNELGDAYDRSNKLPEALSAKMKPEYVEVINLGDTAVLARVRTDLDTKFTTMQINSQHPAWEDDRLYKADEDNGWFPPGSSVLEHEMGHVVDNRNGPGLTRAKHWRELEIPGAEATSLKVSDYAGTNANEFVATTFSGLLAGNTYDPDVMSLYSQLGGEVPPSLGRFPRR